MRLIIGQKGTNKLMITEIKIFEDREDFLNVSLGPEEFPNREFCCQASSE